MATVIETIDTGKGEQGVERASRSIVYVVQVIAGESDIQAIAAANNARPDTYRGLDFETLRITPKEADIFEIEAIYSNKEPKNPPLKAPRQGGKDEGADNANESDGEFNFTTQGGREKIWYSRETVYSSGVANAAAPDFKGGINVTKNGVGGVDITVPTFKFTINKKWDIKKIDGSYIRTLFLMTGRTNDRAWKVNYRGVVLEFLHRELLFMGATGRQTGVQSWDFSYSFEGYPNVNRLAVGNDSNLGSVQEADGTWVIPSKFGTDYLWVNFEEEEDTTTKTIVQRPKSVFVERVYLEANFNLLGL